MSKLIPQDIVKDLIQVRRQLAGFDLALDYNDPQIIHDSGLSTVSWSGSTSPRLAGDVVTLSDYLDVLDNRNYSFLLSDYTVIQASYSFDGDLLKKHRLAVLACPIVIDSEWFDLGLSLQEGIDSTPFEDLVAIICNEVSIRFDYDEASVSNMHPASHATVARACCRMPVHAPLSVGQFARFIIRSYYPEVFPDWVDQDALPGRNLASTLKPDHFQELHVFRRAD